ncbi:MAG: hypothetical protein RTV31_01710 [Candidatus Thorarchaeota archaeon]
MNDELPSSWMSQFLVVLLLVSVSIALIPIALFGPAFIWEYMYPPSGPQPLTTPFLSITMPLFFFDIVIVYFGYGRTKRFIQFNRECYNK